MSTRTAISTVLRVIALTVICAMCFAVAAQVVGLQQATQQAEPSNTSAAAPFLGMCFLHTAVLAHVIIRSRWSRWRLSAAVFLLYYGIVGVLTQIEAAVFVTDISARATVRMLLWGLVAIAMFAPLAVLVLGRWRSSAVEEAPNERLKMPPGQWAWKLVTIAAAYITLYFTFGYFVAWQSAAVREFYSGMGTPSFFSTPWLPSLQALRAMIWVVVALPVIRMMRGSWCEAGLAVALSYAVLMNAGLLVPNAYMPTAVRMTHLVETASSNFVFGWIVVVLLHRAHRLPWLRSAPR
jgi:hypothetical protein